MGLGRASASMWAGPWEAWPVSPLSPMWPGVMLQHAQNLVPVA